MHKTFCFASYLELLKSHATNKKSSNEKIVGDIFSTICEECHIQRETKDDYYSSKELASVLINRKEDIPAKIRKALLHFNFETMNFALCDTFDEIVEDGERIHLENELKSLFLQDININEDDKKYFQKSDYEGNELLTYFLIETAKINNKITEIKYPIYDDDSLKINYMFDDLLSLSFNAKYKNQKRIIVIPVNSDFDFDMDDYGSNCNNPKVSPNSIHGQWVMKMNSLDYSNAKLKELVLQQKKDNGNIGDIVTIQYKNVMFYLLAISKFDEYCNARATEDDINTSLVNLFKFYNSKGQCQELYIPLIGTKLSRAKLSYKKSFGIIKNIAIKMSKEIVGTINIVIFDDDRKKMEDLLNA